MLTLFVYRHAKSAGGGIFTADADRALNERGRRDAPAMGRYLAEHSGRIDLVLCSAASRARETWALTAVELNPEPPVEFEQALYLAGEDGLLARLRELSSSAETVVLVGHNPGLRQLCLALAGAGEAAQLSALRSKFPTAAVARFHFEAVDWSALALGAGQLVDYQTPKRLALEG